MAFPAAVAALPGLVDQIITIGNNKSAKKEARLNRQLQLDTLHNQIQWRVADAKKAGIHPMAALGFTGMSYSPVSTAFQGTDFAGMGQDISRAVMAGQTENQRRLEAGRATLEATQNAEYHALQIENMGLQNQMLASQIGRLNSGQIGPGTPDAHPGAVNIEPDRVTVGSVGAPERSPGMLTDYSFTRTANGFSLVPAYDIKQRIEDMPSELGWSFRNGLIPPARIVQDLTRMYPPDPGYRWQFTPFTQEFTQVAINPFHTPSRRPYRR